MPSLDSEQNIRRGQVSQRQDRAARIARELQDAFPDKVIKVASDDVSNIVVGTDPSTVIPSHETPIEKSQGTIYERGPKRKRKKKATDTPVAHPSDPLEDRLKKPEGRYEVKQEIAVRWAAQMVSNGRPIEGAVKIVQDRVLKPQMGRKQLAQMYRQFKP